MPVPDRYTRALSSRDLRTEVWRERDVDVLAAAGAVRVRLPFTLFRLRAEYDSLAASLRPQEFDRAWAKSLPQARIESGAYLTCLASQQDYSIRDDELERMVSALIEEWLDVACPTCRGTKYKPILGTGRLSAVPCDTCHGSGRQRAQRQKLSKGAKRFFGQAMAELETDVATARRQFARLMK